MTNYNDAYNELCKNILSYKVILAKILSLCVREFEGYGVDTIANLIEGDSTMDKIVGITNNHDGIKYDVLFQTKLPNGENSIGAIVNVEAQKTTRLKYKIVNRALAYVCNGIHYQYNRVYKNQEFDKIHKVVSIWICFDAPTKKEEGIRTTISNTCKRRNGKGD